MCGIAGVIDLENRPIEPGLLLAMSQAISHRGPDDEGYVLIDQASAGHRYYCGPASSLELQSRLPILGRGQPLESADIGLCHRRFSIIDLSDAGHQPLTDQDDTCCVVFNGEIYNYLEVREELEQAGARFRSHSDTEVL